MRALPRLIVAALLLCPAVALAEEEQLFNDKLNVVIPPVQGDPTVKLDYDIAYVRAPRAGDEIHKRFFTDFSSPLVIEPGADLMLLHPDGSEELLVAGGTGSITDPVVSLDGKWVYYVHIHNLENNPSQWSPPREGADIYKINVQSKKIVRLTNQKFTPNLGAGNWTDNFRPVREEYKKNSIDYGVYNMGPYPLPGGRIVFTSNRDGFRPAKGYPAVALQLFVMEDRDESIGDSDDPVNLEKIGHLNISGALHPVVLKDGRIMYSSLESQGLRGDILWGIWTIHPDGTNWNPLVSAFDPGGAPNGFHFQSQLGDGSIVFEEYYNQNNSGFGSLLKMPPSPPNGYSGFGPAKMDDPRNVAWRYGRHHNGRPRWYRMPFMPTGSVSLTPFSHGFEGEADISDNENKASPKVGKFTHPSGAPDNHLLVCYSPGPVNHQYKYLPQVDGGIYVLKNGEITTEPAQLRLVKNDPQYNECWPRAVVPYKRTYGIDEPATLPRLTNDGKKSPHLPEGTPFGLVGSSSMLKRESYPNGSVPEGSVTATFTGKNNPWRGLDEFTSHGNGMALNWHNQGAEAGLYDNSEVHAVRILAMEATTDRKGGERSGRQFHSHAKERLRILGEIPVRKFDDGKESLDPDGNPDTSFLAKIPADVAFTFQTIDKQGLVLNMAQTWHQLRPGEIRHDCGGCHAHSQKPTNFSDTLASKPDYKVFDLTSTTPLVTTKEMDASKQKWDAEGSAGLWTVKLPVINVEYHRDIKPILQRSCVACHSGKDGKSPAALLDLDADGESINSERAHAKLPGTYLRLAEDEAAKFGYKPVAYDSWGASNASRYVRKLQSRRSLLTWKIFGRRLDGFSNDDHPSESSPGKKELVQAGQVVPLEKNRSSWDLDYVGSQMPPPEAVAGTYQGEDGKTVKVPPLSDEDRRTIARWIDLGCPIDLDLSPADPDRPFGWFCDDQRPTLTLNHPAARVEQLDRLQIGMYDYGPGLDAKSLSVTADAELDGLAAGSELADKFKPSAEQVWQWKLAKPLTKPGKVTINVSVRDVQGNLTRVSRTVHLGK